MADEQQVHFGQFSGVYENGPTQSAHFGQFSGVYENGPTQSAHFGQFSGVYENGPTQSAHFGQFTGVFDSQTQNQDVAFGQSVNVYMHTPVQNAHFGQFVGVWNSEADVQYVHFAQFTGVIAIEGVEVGTIYDSLAGEIGVDKGTVQESSPSPVYAPKTSLVVDGIDMGRKKAMYEDFSARCQPVGGAVLTNPNLNFECTGASSASAFGDVGNLLTTDALINALAIATPKADSLWGNIVVDTTKDVVLRWNIKTPDVLDTRIEAGIRPTPTAMDDATDNEKIMFRFDPTLSPNWILVTSQGGVETLTDSLVPVGAQASYQLHFSVNTLGQISAFVNNTRISDPAVTSVVTAALGTIYAGIKTLANASKSVELVGSFFSRLSQ